MDFRTLLNAPGFVRLDGAMGTMLQRKGLPVGMAPELAGLEHPDWLLESTGRIWPPELRSPLPIPLGPAPLSWRAPAARLRQSSPPM